MVGDMGGISKEIRNAFTAAGVNHVLSISGLHVAMLGVVIFAAIRYGLSFSSYLLLRCQSAQGRDFFFFLGRGVLHRPGRRAWCRRCARRS